MAMLKIPVSKAKGEYIEIDTEKVPDEMYAEALYQGLKQMLGRGMSKISKSTYPKEDELKAAAKAKAEENAKAILENNKKVIKPTGAPKDTKLSGAVNTEAMRLARNVVKDELKKAGIKISHVEASEITKAAKEILANKELGDPIIEQAKQNLAEREATQVAGKIDIKSLVKTSPKLIAAAEAKKAKAKAEKGEQLSAKQAGKSATRAKPNATAPATVQ